MIIKRIANPKTISTNTQRVNSLLSYIEKPETRNREEKCIYLGKKNFEFDDFHRLEMSSIADMSTRTKDPIRHYVMSWKEHEHPTNKQVDRAVEILLDEMRCPENQVVYALHTDTDNTHLHVVMNRVHPQTHRPIQPEKCLEIEALHRAIARIEHEQGWEREKNSRYQVREDGRVERIERINRVPQPKQKTQDRENHIGEKSAERVGIEKAGPITQHAQTWKELHSQLADVGMAYDRKGSGAVIRVGEAYIKASSVGRHASLKALEKRLGPFEARDPKQQIAKVDHTQPLEKKFSSWHEYNRERKEFFREKYSLKNAIHKRQNEERLNHYSHQKEERKTIFEKAKKHRIAYPALKSVLAAEQAKATLDLRERHKAEKIVFRMKYDQFPGYEEWLRNRGLEHIAEEWRHRISDAPTLIPNQSKEFNRTEKKDIRDFDAFIQKRDVYYIKTGTKGMADFVDKGSKISIINWKKDEVLLASMQLAMQKWGGFTVIGNKEFIDRCQEVAAHHGIQIITVPQQDNQQTHDINKNITHIRVQEWDHER